MNRIILFISLLITICLSQTITTPPITTPPFNTTLPPLSDLEYQQQFTDFLVSYNKSYTNVEFNQRFLIFKDNLNYILNFNSLTRNDTDVLKLGVNQFADITSEEFYDIYLNKIIGTNQTTNSTTTTSTTTTSTSTTTTTTSTSTSPSSTSSTTGSGSGLLTGVLGGTTGGLLGNLLGTTVNVLTGIGSKKENQNINIVQSRKLNEVSTASSVDWRSLTPTIKDQGGCGSCYAFSAVGAVEAAIKKETGRQVLLSEQEIVDCSRCKGGFMVSSFDYIIQNFGINHASAYPYKGTDQPCHYMNGPKEKINGAIEIPYGDEVKLQNYLSVFGPVSVAIYANMRSFQFYQSGIYEDPQCPTTVTHAILLVAMGTNNGIPFYVVKNSWGARWGESGYFRIVRGKNMCGIANMASLPLTTTSTNTSPPFNTTVPPLSELEYQQNFTDFIFKYNKSYTNVEFDQRFLIFKDNLNYIRNFNSLTRNHTDAISKDIGTNQTTTTSSTISSTSSTTGSGSGGLLTGVLGGTTGGLLGNLLGTTVNVLTGIGSKKVGDQNGEAEDTLKWSEE